MNPSSNNREIPIRWEGYFENLLHITPHRSNTVKSNRTCILTQPIILKEVNEETLRRAHTQKKAAGFDKFPIEIIKATGGTRVWWLHRLCNMAAIYDSC